MGKRPLGLAPVSSWSSHCGREKESPAQVAFWALAFIPALIFRTGRWVIAMSPR